MDVNSALAVIRAAIREFEAATDQADMIWAATDVVEQFKFLDEQMSAGHVLPFEWWAQSRQSFTG